jgi:hypothetical protein
MLLLVVVECLVLYAGSLFPGGFKLEGIPTLGRSDDDKLLLEREYEKDNAKPDVTSAANATDAILVIQDQVNRKRTEQMMLEQVAFKFESSKQYLRNLTLRYYVYDDWPAAQLINDTKLVKVPEEPYIFSALLTNNTWRVTDPARADVFFAPTPLASYSRLLPETRMIISTLTEHPVFRKHQGHRHVVFALGGRWFDVGKQNIAPSTKRFNRILAPRLENVSVAKQYDTISCRKLADDQQDHGDWNYYYATFRPILKYTFSLGHLAGAYLPLIPATYEKFLQMEYTLFYHTRTAPFKNRSTPYRWAPLNVTLPYNASIGYDIPKDLWLERFTSSKFCLVFRGDDPLSHALLRAVKVGCIPVVISDYMPIIAPTFKTSMDMRDFSIFLDEQEFLNNPQDQLASLHDISELEIRTKLIALRYAQQVTCPDHPDSLFLPALLREADASFQPTYTH